VLTRARAPPHPLCAQQVGDIVEGTLLSVDDLVAGRVSNALLVLDNGTMCSLPRSQVSHKRITNIGNILREGDILTAMVLKVDAEVGTVSLSTKVLEPVPGDMVLNRQLVFDKAEETAEAWMQERLAYKNANYM
jgi:ribosomal protein S1